MSPYGMTFKQLAEFIPRLAEKLGVEPEKVRAAMSEITREEANRIAKNEIEEEQ